MTIPDHFPLDSIIRSPILYISFPFYQYFGAWFVNIRIKNIDAGQGHPRHVAVRVGDILAYFQPSYKQD